MSRAPSAPPPPSPPEYDQGCKAADDAADLIEKSSERVAEKLWRRRQSGRWSPPPPRTRRHASSAP